MARMSRLVALVTILSGHGLAAQVDDLGASKYWTELPRGQVLLTIIPSEAFDNSPRWLASDPNPPLSARRAISLAENTKNKVVKELQLPGEPDYEWVLLEAALVPRFDDETDDLWFWKVRYEVRRVGGQTGPRTFVPFYVLTDGTSIEPKLDDQ